MQTRWKTTIALLALSLPLAAMASACDEDNVSERVEDKDGINDVPPPSGGTESGSGDAAAVGPSGVQVGATIAVVGTGGNTGDGGAGPGGGGDGGAGQGGGTGGAGGGGTSENFGGVGSCALFPVAFANAPICTEDADSLKLATDDFAAGGAILDQFGCPDASVVREAALGADLLSVLEVGVAAAGEPCADPTANTRNGFLLGCDAQVTLPDDPDFMQAEFGLRDLEAVGDQSDWGTISLKTVQSGENVTLTAERYGPDASGGSAMPSPLGVRTGENLPLRQFIAHDPVQGQTCAGVVRGGEYICVGCWKDDIWTDAALTDGALVFSSAPTGLARFDQLNLP